MIPLRKLVFSTNFQRISKYYLRDPIILTKSLNFSNSVRKYIYNSAKLAMNLEEKQKSITLFDTSEQRKKEKSTFIDVIHTYTSEERLTGHVSFIYMALQYMDEYGVNEDLEAYKEILNTMPKGKYVTNLFQTDYMYYAREHQCIIDLLQKMENNGVLPDPELELMIINVCGQYSFALRKCRRMAYWQTKFKNLNPWPMPRPLPTDSLELAKLAIQKIATVDVQSIITIFNTEDVENSIDKTWIVSASSPDQEKLISKHPTNVAAYVEGPYRIWISEISVDYFILRTDILTPRKVENINVDDISNLDISLGKRSKKQLAEYRSIHEQDDQIILGVCATGTSSKDSLLSWIRCLQPKNPALMSIPILFKFIRKVDDYKKINAGDTKINDLKKIA